jgi:outer membrane protein
MKGFAIVASLAAALSAAPVFAQPPTQPPAPRPATPAQPPSTQPPAQPAPAPAVLAAQPPAPFPAGSKVAFINPPRIFQESVEGKAALARINAVSQKKQTENQQRQKALADNQQKLQTSGSVMNDAARSQLEKEIEKQQVDMQRFQQDAQAEINELQNEVQAEFVKKVTPIIDAIATEKGLHIVFNGTEAGFAWASPGLDITTEVIKKLDAGKAPATPPKP